MSNITIASKVMTVCVFVLLILWAVISQVNARKFGRREFKVFYSSHIEGVIQRKVKASNMGTFIVVNGVQYNFLPYTSELNNHSIFMNTAQKGDSLIKLAYSDTLLLIKKDQRLKYTFNKFEN